MKNNFVTMSDCYKFSHAPQYPPNTEIVSSYLESRGGVWPSTMFFGLQYYLKMIEGVQVTQEKIDYAEPRIDACMGPGTFNREGWEHIVNAHEGRLPVRIKAVPEGMIIPISNIK